MKKLFLLLTITLLAFSLHAQEEPSWKETMPRHDLQFGIGDPALLFVADGNIGWGCRWDDQSADDWFTNDTYNALTLAIPTLNFEYRYRLAKWFWLGAAFSYTTILDHWNDCVTGDPVARTSRHFITLMPSVRFSWLNKKYITLYSGLSMGCTIAPGSDYYQNRNRIYKTTDVYFAGQLTCVGIQGGKNWYGFAETGIGTQGFIKVGFGYKFNKNTQ